MPQDIERVRRIKAAAEDDLLSRPGVTAVDVGYKFVNGRKTDEIVIRIHVAEKKDVPQDQKIPDTIQGVKTDVIQKQFRPAGDRGYYNTILGGIDIGPLRAVDLQSIAGTLGAIVIDNSTQHRMLLSNYHVLCVNEGWNQWGMSDGASHNRPSVASWSRPSNEGFSTRMWMRRSPVSTTAGGIPAGYRILAPSQEPPLRNSAWRFANGGAALD